LDKKESSHQHQQTCNQVVVVVVVFIVGNSLSKLICVKDIVYLNTKYNEMQTKIHWTRKNPAINISRLTIKLLLFMLWFFKRVFPYINVLKRNSLGIS
jgi:hypothetical protein